MLPVSCVGCHPRLRLLREPDVVNDQSAGLVVNDTIHPRDRLPQTLAAHRRTQFSNSRAAMIRSRRARQTKSSAPNDTREETCESSRRSSVRSLWRHVDWAGRCIRLDAHTTKDDEGGIFPFTADIETILTKQLAIHRELAATGTILMPGWLPLRQLHRRPPSPLSVEVVDSGAVSRSESGCSRVGTGSTNP